MFAPSLRPHYRDFLTTMGSADISQFVVTTADGTACEISTLKVRALFPHLPATFTGTSSNFWASSLLADLPVFPSLVCGSCSSGQGFPTASFRFHLTMDTLAVQLCTSSLPTRTRDLHPLERAHGAQTQKNSEMDHHLRAQALHSSIKITVPSSSFIQTILSAPESHRIMPLGPRALPPVGNRTLP